MVTVALHYVIKFFVIFAYYIVRKLAIGRL
jgi:hypothetical protein